MTETFAAGLQKIYDEAGGEDGILRLLKVFYAKMQSDVMLGFFFTGKDIDHIVRQQQSFLLRAMGKSLSYSGMAPGAAHKKIPPILKGHFDRRLVLLRETLTEERLTPEAISSWVGFEEHFRKSIVEEEKPLSERKKRP